MSGLTVILPRAVSATSRKRRLGRWSLFLLVAAVTIAPPGCRRSAPIEPEHDRHNVILVLVDTLRADHLGVYGYSRDTSPNIDRFAHDAVVFERARSQSSCTFASVNSMLTSRYTARFLGQAEGRMGIPRDVPTVAELLRDRGYATAAVSASPIVRKTAGPQNPHGGFDAGFEAFDEECLWMSAECVTDRAMQIIETIGSPFFLYLHYMDPHDPYRPPDSHDLRFAGEYSGHDFISMGDPNPIGEMIYGSGPAVDIGPRDVQHLVDLYDEEIASFDRWFGRLIDWLGARGLLANTIVVVAADHGEEFLEHGHVKHCRTVFEASTRTPLIFHIPGVDRGRRVVPPAENLDIVPTIFDYVGIELSDEGLQGISLRPLIEGRDVSRTYVYSLQYPWSSVDDGRLKLISNLTARQHRLFDIEADPLEENDLADTNPDAVELLRSVMTPWIQTEVGELADPSKFEHSLDLLKALGYIE